MARGNHTGKGGFGDNPQNINQHGQRNKAAVSFARSLREYIIKEGKVSLKYVDDKTGKIHKATKIETVVRAVYREAMQGNMQAVNFIAERVEGKIKDQLEVTGAEGQALFNYATIDALFANRPNGDTTG